MLVAKPLPRLTLKNLMPPPKDYHYFQQGAGIPFNPACGHFSLVNAWWLSEAALLAYGEPDFARPRFLRAGFRRVHFISGATTRCYLLSAPGFNILAFRGTESDLRKGMDALVSFMADLRTDFNVRFVPHPDGGQIHRGFDKALNEVWKAIHTHLREASGQPLWMTGHSLGGALATLAAGRWKDTRAVYTFGSPRVGDGEFVRCYRTPIYRFVNHHDMVARMPPKPYAPLGHLCRLDHAGRLSWDEEIEEHTPPLFELLKEKLEGMVQAPHGSKLSTMATLPEVLKDHAPLLYSLNIWNNIVAEKKRTECVDRV